MSTDQKKKINYLSVSKRCIFTSLLYSCINLHSCPFGFLSCIFTWLPGPLEVQRWYQPTPRLCFHWTFQHGEICLIVEGQYGGSPWVQKQSGNCSSSGPELCLAREELIIEGTCRDEREGNESSIREQARAGVERRVVVICRHLKGKPVQEMGWSYCFYLPRWTLHISLTWSSCVFCAFNFPYISVTVLIQSQ